MELYKILFMLILARYSYCGYTGYNVLLWLSSDEDVAPSDVWSDSSSVYNNDTNTTATQLLQTGTRGYRNTFIDTWASNPPDRTRVTYRNKDGSILFRAKFNSTGSSNTDWFAVSKVVGDSWSALSYELNHSYTSYSVDFTMSDRSLDPVRYRAASLKLANGTEIFIVGTGRTFALLPATPTVAGDCYASYLTSNPFSINVTKTNMTHIYCSGFCRERNYPQGGVHGETCSCLDAAAGGPTLTACTEPCAGNSDEMCGGDLPPAIIFNAVNTDIDISQFDKPLTLMEEVQVNGETEVISYQWAMHLYGFNVTIASVNLPASIRMVLHYRAERCSSTLIPNSTYEKTFSVNAVDTYFILEMEPLLVQCVYISLYDNNTNNATTFPINMTMMSVERHNFVTAQFFTIEASWQTVEEQTTPTPTEECECDCWVYNLLYGDSPYNNLSYKQIEDALRNVTQKHAVQSASEQFQLNSPVMQPSPSPPPWATELLIEIKDIKQKLKVTEKIEKIVKSINIKVSDLELKLKSLDTRVTESESACEYKENEQNKAEMKRAKDEIKQLKETCRSIGTDAELVLNKYEKLKPKVTDLESRSMKDSLDIGKNVSAKILIDRAARVGHFEKSKKPLPIVAKFHYPAEREHVRKVPFGFMDQLNSAKLGSGAQLSREIRNIRKHLYPVIQAAKVKGKNIKFVGSKLFIDGKEFSEGEDQTAATVKR